MADLRPFRAFRPRPDIAERVACPPYDVVNTAEAAELARGNPFSFLHVTRPEIDLPADRFRVVWGGSSRICSAPRGGCNWWCRSPWP